MENMAERIGLTSAVVAKIEWAEKFLHAFYAAIGTPFDGENRIPGGKWSGGVRGSDISLLEQRFGYCMVANAENMLRSVRQAMHESLAYGTPVKNVKQHICTLYTVRSILRLETLLVKNAPTSVLTERLLYQNVIDRPCDRLDAVDTYHDAYDRAFTKALGILSYQLCLMTRLDIIDKVNRHNAEVAARASADDVENELCEDVEENMRASVSA